jgi:hypothetical protein
MLSLEVDSEITLRDLVVSDCKRLCDLLLDERGRIEQYVQVPSGIGLLAIESLIARYHEAAQNGTGIYMGVFLRMEKH